MATNEMHVLVLGGTIFLGRAVVTEALAAGHQVTTFSRGISGEPPAGATALHGDRTDPQSLSQLAGRHFDLVVDTCGYVPADVDAAARVLEPTTDHYAFVSTINVYPGWPTEPDYHARGPHQGNPDATRADLPADFKEEMEYGWLKAGCEQAALRAFGAERSSILRAGLIVGPHDSAVGRLPWWIARVARGGDVLVPGTPADPLRMIDARDLARFALARPVGTFETCGPAGQTTRGELMQTCRDVNRSDASFVYVDEEWLAAEGVEAWTEVPLWVPKAEAPSAFDHDTAAAEAAGLRCRPVRDTVADTWAWQQSIEGGWKPTARTPGLDPAREAELLEKWHAG